MLFLSIHPEHVESIVAGRKTIELRKRQPKADLGSSVVIYATAPRCEVVATATLHEVHVATPDDLWRQVSDRTAVSRKAFDAYYQDAQKAVGIHLTDVNVFDNPLKLSELRRRWDGFQPPQQFRYLDSRQQALIRSRLMRTSADEVGGHSGHSTSP